MTTLPPSSASELSGRSPLRLDDPRKGWRVVAGRVDLFAAEPLEGEPRGRRHAIGGVAAGEALFGVTPRDDGVALIAVGSGGARVEALDERLEPLERAGLAERWVDTLATASPAWGQRASVLLHAGRRAELSAGETVSSSRGAVWIDDASTLAFDGAALSGAIPVVSGLVLEAREETVLEPVDGQAATASEESWRRGLDALGGALLDGLSRALASADDRERATLAHRRQEDRGETERVFTDLARVIERRGEPVAAPGERAIAAACRIAGGPLGIAVIAPARLRGTSFVTRLREVARASGFRFREVRLDDGWWRADVGPLVALDEGDRPVALVRRRGRYEIVDPERGARIAVDARTATTLAPTAYMLYACLGSGPSDGRKLLRLGVLPVRADLVRLLLTSVALGLLSLATPIAAQTIFNRVVPQGDRSALLGIALVLLGAALGAATAYLAQGLALLRLEGRASTGSQAAVIDRLLDLPASFFRAYSAGDLSTRAMGVEMIRESLTTSVTATLVALLIAFFNLAYIFTLNVALGLIALGLLLAAAIVLALVVRRQIPHQRRLQAALGHTQALALQILGAVPKLRVARAEERAFARWAAGLGRMKSAFVDSQRILIVLSAFVAGWQAIAMAFVLLAVGEDGSATTLSTGDFVAFTTAFGTTSAAVLGLVTSLSAATQAAVLWERARPIVQSAPELATGDADPGELRGQVDFAHVSFRYGDDAPLVLDDVSFSAAPGEFVALVGPSGAGKSTVFRLLLGFEQPAIGTISYDGQSLADIDTRAVRRQLGAVIQNARILSGSIFQNIVGAANLSVDDAWEAARIAGIADEIASMPMGMHTFVSEVGAAFSGGQRQRLLIARAVVTRPRVLLFDEATSALDNRTQAAVSRALDELQATRIVIAHRLSTIRTADQILVLERGRVVERGRYDELMASGGLFAALARRQIA